MVTSNNTNHFIEIQREAEKEYEWSPVWVMLHSGSRNLGKKVCDHYTKIAQELNEKWYSKVPKEWDLAFLPTESDEGQAYLREMNYCLEFAAANRKAMCDIIKEIIWEEVGLGIVEEINIHHNYAAMENFNGHNVLVHRKGATRARAGELGIIPGSQGTKSYIVRGLGNKLSFHSCSHGAGRVMGRKQAQRELDLEKEAAALDAKGILHSLTTQESLEEAPSAYKDIDVVMENQRDLVEIVTALEPLAVVKG